MKTIIVYKFREIAVKGHLDNLHIKVLLNRYGTVWYYSDSARRISTFLSSSFCLKTVFNSCTVQLFAVAKSHQSSSLYRVSLSSETLFIPHASGTNSSVYPQGMRTHLTAIAVKLQLLPTPQLYSCNKVDILCGRYAGRGLKQGE